MRNFQESQFLDLPEQAQNIAMSNFALVLVPLQSLSPTCEAALCSDWLKFLRIDCIQRKTSENHLRLELQASLKDNLCRLSKSCTRKPPCFEKNCVR